MRNRQVEFRPAYPQFDLPPFKPASKYVPTWYKKTPIVAEKTLTAKRCVPILDALTSGYTLETPVDIHWDYRKAETESPYWYDAKFQFVSVHYKAQTESFDLADNLDPQPYKWNNFWHIKLPKGYSAVFTHPINRTELPFVSFTGIVDADKHPLIINFPFFIQKEFVGVIPAGTPIIQFIPFKREKWTGVIKDSNKSYRYAREYEVFEPPFAWYKRNWWTKKTYS